MALVVSEQGRRIWDGTEQNPWIVWNGIWDVSWEGEREGPGEEKHRKAGRRERKCSGGVWAVGAMLASLSSMFQHCRLSSTLIKSSFFCASSFPVQSCLCESGEHSGGSKEEKDKESLYPLHFSEKGVRHLVILQLIIFWWWP